MENIKVGSIVEVMAEEGHLPFRYRLRVKSIDEEYMSDNGIRCCVAYGEGVTQEDKEFADEFTSRIDEQNFVKVIN